MSAYTYYKRVWSHRDNDITTHDELISRHSQSRLLVGFGFLDLLVFCYVLICGA
jgi:hypothetical protein